MLEIPSVSRVSDMTALVTVDTPLCRMARASIQRRASYVDLVETENDRGCPGGSMVNVLIHEFLTHHRLEVIGRWTENTLEPPASGAAAQQRRKSILDVLEKLIRFLRMASLPVPSTGGAALFPMAGAAPAVAREIIDSATHHGRRLHDLGLTADQVVREYHNLGLSVCDLAIECDVHFRGSEIRAFGHALNESVAQAIAGYSRQREIAAAASQSAALNRSLGYLAHELRNRLQTATSAYAALEHSNDGLSETAGAVLERSLIGASDLIDRALADVRLKSETAPRPRFNLADFIASVRHAADLDASAKGCVLNVSPVDRGLVVEADQDAVFSAVHNLLQNAFKFTQADASGHARSQVDLSAYSERGRIRIEVTDHCGGLPSGEEDRIFTPFRQVGANRSGLGLGLAIARDGVEASNGRLTVSSVPREYCMFRIELPQFSIAGGESGPEDQALTRH